MPRKQGIWWCRKSSETPKSNRPIGPGNPSDSGSHLPKNQTVRTSPGRSPPSSSTVAACNSIRLPTRNPDEPKFLAAYLAAQARLACQLAPGPVHAVRTAWTDLERTFPARQPDGNSARKRDFPVVEARRLTHRFPDGDEMMWVQHHAIRHHAGGHPTELWR